MPATKAWPCTMVSIIICCNPDSAMYTGGGACGLSTILNIVTITVALMLAPLTITYRAIKQIQMTEQLLTINPDTGIFNP